MVYFWCLLKNSIFQPTKELLYHMKKFFLLFLALIQYQLYAQDTTTYEKPPVFSECQSEDIAALKACFYNQLSQHIYNNFKVPEIVSEENYTGDVVVLFEVDAEGGTEKLKLTRRMLSQVDTESVVTLSNEKKIIEKLRKVQIY